MSVWSSCGSETVVGSWADQPCEPDSSLMIYRGWGVLVLGCGLVWVFWSLSGFSVVQMCKVGSGLVGQYVGGGVDEVVELEWV